MNAASFGFCERALRIEWRKCSIRESRTHCVPKFARKYFDEISSRAAANGFFEKTFERQRSTFLRKSAAGHHLAARFLARTTGILSSQRPAI
jgi:hypothetical protein